MQVSLSPQHEGNLTCNIAFPKLTPSLVIFFTQARTSSRSILSENCPKILFFMLVKEYVLLSHEDWKEEIEGVKTFFRRIFDSLFDGREGLFPNGSSELAAK